MRDLFILATAQAEELAIATRNVKHFCGHGVPIINPFAEASLQ